MFTNGYGAYSASRNASWQALLDLEITQLPISTSRVAKRLDIKVVSYKHSQSTLSRLDLFDVAASCSGFALHSDEGFAILYDPDCSNARLRFTIAHELGHILLGHMLDGRLFVARQNIGEPFRSTNPEETAANQFSARFLAPACALWGLGLHTGAEIADVTGTSLVAAGYRAERMKLLYERNRFLMHPLEREVYRQMLPWIQSIQPDAPENNGLWTI